MKRAVCLLITCFILSCLCRAQIGINTNLPVADLDVEGKAITNEKLYLENPGESFEIRGAQLIIQRTDQSIVKYDINVSKYGPINYAQLIFRETHLDGILDYDTKISTAEYGVTIQGYYFREWQTNGTGIIGMSNSGDGVVEGFQVYAYKNTTTNTWFIRAFINNGTFKPRTNNVKSIDIYLNLFIFRLGFISKEIPVMNIDMGGQDTRVLPKPSSF